MHHLVWFENADTLTIKYKIVNLLPVKGEFIKVIELLIIKLAKMFTFFFPMVSFSSVFKCSNLKSFYFLLNVYL